VTSLRISNEFADVAVRIVRTGNGERLEVESLRRGGKILLDSVELEALTWQTPDTFSRMLRGSLGPDAPDFQDLAEQNGTISRESKETT